MTSTFRVEDKVFVKYEKSYYPAQIVSPDDKIVPKKIRSVKDGEVVVLYHTLQFEKVSARRVRLLTNESWEELKDELACDISEDDIRHVLEKDLMDQLYEERGKKRKLAKGPSTSSPRSASPKRRGRRISSSKNLSESDGEKQSLKVEMDVDSNQHTNEVSVDTSSSEESDPEDDDSSSSASEFEEDDNEEEEYQTKRRKSTPSARGRPKKEKKDSGTGTRKRVLRQSRKRRISSSGDEEEEMDQKKVDPPTKRRESHSSTSRMKPKPISPTAAAQDVLRLIEEAGSVSPSKLPIFEDILSRAESIPMTLETLLATRIGKAFADFQKSMGKQDDPSLQSIRVRTKALINQWKLLAEKSGVQKSTQSKTSSSSTSKELESSTSVSDVPPTSIFEETSSKPESLPNTTVDSGILVSPSDGSEISTQIASEVLTSASDSAVVKVEMLKERNTAETKMDIDIRDNIVVETLNTGEISQVNDVALVSNPIEEQKEDVISSSASLSVEITSVTQIAKMEDSDTTASQAASSDFLALDPRLDSEFSADMSAISAAANDYSHISDRMNNDLRNRCRALILTSLEIDSSSDDASNLFFPPSFTANCIEEEIYRNFSSEGDSNVLYKERVRTLSKSLKLNKQLREEVLLWLLLPKRFIRMNADELANEDQRKKFEEADKKLIRDSSSKGLVGNITTDFVCPKCKNDRCLFVELQTRSADEPMTVFCTCLACKHHFRGQ